MSQQTEHYEMKIQQLEKDKPGYRPELAEAYYNLCFQLKYEQELKINPDSTVELALKTIRFAGIGILICKSAIGSYHDFLDRGMELIVKFSDFIICNSYEDENTCEEARFALIDVTSYPMTTENKKTFSEAYELLGVNEMNHKRYQKAVNEFTKETDLLKEETNVDYSTLGSAYQFMAESYEMLHHHEQAIAYYELASDCCQKDYENNQEVLSLLRKGLIYTNLIDLYHDMGWQSREDKVKKKKAVLGKKISYLFGSHPHE